MQRKAIDKWVTQGKKNCKSYVFYQDKVLDLSDFIIEHPGGIKAIKNYVYKDITNILFQVYPHDKPSTLNKIFKYQIGLIPEQQATNPREKLQRVPNSDRPKSKKKVCFTQQNDKLPQNTHRHSPNDDQMKKSQKRSTHKNKQNMKESTHNSTPSKNTSKCKSKHKNTEFLTSIRVLNSEENKTYEDYFLENQQKVRSKQRANTEKKKEKKQKSPIGSFSFQTNQLDEEKPNFKVPILFVKPMSRHV